MSDWTIPLIVSIIITFVCFMQVYSTYKNEDDSKKFKQLNDNKTPDGDRVFDWDFPLLVAMSWVIFSIEYGSVIAQWVIGVVSVLLYIITRREREVTQLNYVPLN